MTKKTMNEIRAFVNGIFLSATEGREFPNEPMCVKEAYEMIDNWKRDGVELPKGLTAYYLAVAWDEAMGVNV